MSDDRTPAPTLPDARAALLATIERHGWRRLLGPGPSAMPLLAAGDLHREHWIVRPLGIEVARAMVERYHYAHGASLSATELHGLFHHERTFWDADCYGVAWWIPSTRDAAAATFKDNPDAVLALSRLVIHPGAPRNAASFLLSKSMQMLDARWRVLVTYADTWRGHTGGIYRATNWQYVGLTVPEPVFVRDGVMRGRKTGSGTYTRSEMQTRGFSLVGRYAKHKFVYRRAIA